MPKRLPLKWLPCLGKMVSKHFPCLFSLQWWITLAPINCCVTSTQCQCFICKSSLDLLRTFHIVVAAHSPKLLKIFFFFSKYSWLALALLCLKFSVKEIESALKHLLQKVKVILCIICERWLSFAFIFTDAHPELKNANFDDDCKDGIKTPLIREVSITEM